MWWADSDGNTVLHTAAINCKPSSVAWILEKSENIRSQRNSCGKTPEDALKARLEDLRTTRRHGTFTEDVSDQFAGFDTAALSCLIQLSGQSNIVDANALRLQLECTCGQCISGSLSPRMPFSLLCQSEINFDLHTVRGYRRWPVLGAVEPRLAASRQKMGAW